MWSSGVMVISLMIPLVLVLLVMAISFTSDLHRDKVQPFECGFEAISSARTPFSIKFYMVVIIFLIFDVEIVLILPLPLIRSLMSDMDWWAVSVFMFGILLWGLLLEWYQGALSWVD